MTAAVFDMRDLPRGGPPLPPPPPPLPPPRLASPLVTGLLVVADPPQQRLARLAAQAFLAQTYQARQLLLVNGTDAPVFAGGAPPGVEEVHVAPVLPPSAMHNHGLDLARGDWILPLSCDEYLRPDRLAYQMAHRRDGVPCVLRCQIRVNLLTSTAFYHEPEPAVAATLLHPRTTARYAPASGGGGPQQFLADTWGANYVALDNRPYAATHVAALSVAFYHGRHAEAEGAWMADGPPPGQSRLLAHDNDHLTYILSQYGVRATVGAATVAKEVLSPEP